MKIEVDEQLLRDIEHLTVWYQGRDVDRCERVELFLDKHLNRNEKKSNVG